MKIVFLVIALLIPSAVFATALSDCTPPFPPDNSFVDYGKLILQLIPYIIFFALPLTWMLLPAYGWVKERNSIPSGGLKLWVLRIWLFGGIALLALTLADYLYFRFATNSLRDGIEFLMVAISVFVATLSMFAQMWIIPSISQTPRKYRLLAVMCVVVGVVSWGVYGWFADGGGYCYYDNDHKCVCVD